MTNSTENVPAPVPGSISYKSVLAQDFVTSDGVLVDRTQRGQVGVFRNPSKRSAVEALVLSNYGGVPQQLFYLARERTVTGWSMKPLLNGGSPITASQVVALANTAGGVDGFYVDKSGALMHIELQRDTWSAPVAVSAAPANLCDLRVAYSPGASGTSGTVVVYAGQKDPDSASSLTKVFLLVREGGGPWTGTSLAPGGLVSSWALTLTSAKSWLLTVLARSNFTLSPNYHQPIVTIQQGQGAWLSGALGSDKVTAAPMSKELKLAFMAHDAAAVGGTADTMLLGLDGPADSQGGHALRWVLNPKQDRSASGTLAGTSFTDITVIGSTAGYVTVFGVDPQMSLFAVRQVGYSPAAMGSSFADDQTWGPVLQLDARIARMYPDVSPSNTPALIAVDADVGALHLYVMDPGTSLWLTKPITLPTTHPYEITTWQTDITALDTTGAPLVNYELDLRAASATDLLVNAEYQVVTSTTSARVRTNELGKLLVSSLATSLAPPAFVLSGAAVPPQGSCSPGTAVNDYFSGAGSILGKPTFSPDAVKQMSPDTRLSADDAAKAYDAIRQCALMGADAGAPPMAQAAAEHGPRYHVFTRKNGALIHRSVTDAQEAHDLAGASAATVWDDVWDATKRFAGDVWHAIEKGIHAVESFIVDVGKKVITIVVKIGDALVKLADWVIDTVEAGLRAISAVFNWIKVTIEKAIAWLKALFDFKAIWHTKEALAGLLHGVPGLVTKAIDGVSRQLASFTGATKENVHAFFDPLIARYDGQKLASNPSFPQLGQPPSSDPMVGSVSAADLVTNPSANWMQNKVVSNAPADYAPPTSPDDAIDNFFSAIADVGDDLLTIFTDLYTGVLALFDPDDPRTFSEVLISTLLQMTRDALIAVLDVFDTFVQGLLALGEVAMKGIQAVLDQRLNWGFVNEIYRWIAKKAGGASEDLTIGNLVALMAAFPITIAYKLIAGAEREPFPDGKFPSPPRKQELLAAAGADDTAKLYREVCLTTSGVLAILGGGIVAACDFIGEAPSFLGVCSMVVTTLHTVASMPDWVQWGIEFGAENWPPLVCVGAFMGISAIVLTPDAYGAYLGLQKKVEGKLAGTKRLKECDFGDVTKIALSIYGLGNFGWTIYGLVRDKYTPLLICTSRFAESLVTPFAVATIKPIRRLNVDGVPVGRLIQGMKVGLDVAGGVEGGALEISSAWLES
jgi:hypothetical protein